ATPGAAEPRAVPRGAQRRRRPRRPAADPRRLPHRRPRDLAGDAGDMGVARAALVALVAVGACRSQDPPPARPTGQTIRVAVIGGVIETGVWPALAERYQAARGNRIEPVAARPKAPGIEAFRRRGLHPHPAPPS